MSFGIGSRLKKNRLANPDKTGNVAIELLTIPPEGVTIHLKEYGFIKVFRIVSKDGDTQYWATHVLDLRNTIYSCKMWKTKL